MTVRLMLMRILKEAAKSSTFPTKDPLAKMNLGEVATRLIYRMARPPESVKSLKTRVTTQEPAGASDKVSSAIRSACLQYLFLIGANGTF